MVQTSKSAPQTEFRKVAECLYRNESSRTYYALVKKGGKQHRQSLKTKDRKLAERRLTEFRRKVDRLSPTESGSKVDFATLAKRWLDTLKPTLKESSWGRRFTSIAKITPYLGNLTLRALTARHCEDWANQRNSGIAASTYNNERDTIIAILNYALREGLILDNPATVLKRRKQGRTEIDVPTKEEFALLVKTLRSSGQRYQAAANLVELLAYSGMRLAEGTSMRWRDVQFTAGKFVVTGGELGTKNHEVRTVPLFPALKAFLERLRDARPHTSEDLVIGIASAKNAMASACKTAGIRDYSHHSLRHYFVSNAIEVGIDFKVIAGWVGHKDGGLLVAKTYGHLRDSHSSAMAERMTFSAVV